VPGSFGLPLGRSEAQDPGTIDNRPVANNQIILHGATAKPELASCPLPLCETASLLSGVKFD
jgi:hypothetical protein